MASLAFAPASGAAQVPDTASVPGSELSVYLMTMGQGDQVWERFGHNAIGIRDRTTGTDVVFNWGIFSFDEPGFLGRFLRGEMMYWMAGQGFASTLSFYQSTNRTVEIQELNLSPPQRVALADFIQWNAREENKFYRYDYFLDNCSTRARDALDRVLGGAIRGATDSVVTSTTYRWHALRLMAEDPVVSTGINIGLGRGTDRPITAWAEMFIPMKVRDRVREIRVPDDSGRLVPLVLSERVAFQATRTPERDAPPALWLPLSLIGLVVGAALGWLGGSAAGGNGAARRGAGIVAFVVALKLGAFGAVLLFLRLMTQHTAAYDNTNLFVYNPLWLLIAVGMLLARSVQVRRLTYLLATIVGGLTLLGVMAPFVPGFDQGSFAVIAAATPAALATTWIIRQRTRPDAAATA